MIQMIMQLVQNRNFTRTTASSDKAGCENVIPQRSILAPLLYNIHTYNLPSFVSKKYAYADDLRVIAFIKQLEERGGSFKPKHVYTFGITPG